MPVNVASGTDAALVERLLLVVAQGTDDVLEKPPAAVNLTSLGTTSMLFELAVWHLPLGPTRHELGSRLNMAIAKLLREQEIKSV